MTGEIILLGTIGQSVWRSEDGGVTWTRGHGGLFMESDVRAILPLGGSQVLLGSETGLFRSEDTGRSWTAVSSFPTGYQIWTLGISQRPSAEGDSSRDSTSAPERIWAGTCPAALFFSDDGGQRWQEAPARWLRTCAKGAIVTRVTSFLAVGSRLLAGVEIDGVQRSEDGGQTWGASNEGLTSLDIHGLAAIKSSGADGETLVAATNQDCFVSHDDGSSWKPLSVGKRFRWPYCRAVALDRDGRSLLVGNGSGPPGDGGALWKTPDLGETWEEERIPHPPNSTLWEIIVTPEATWTYSVLGQVYRQGAGKAWEKLPREFGEIRALRIIPPVGNDPNS